MPSTIKKDETGFDDPNSTRCITCPSNLVLAHDLDLQDHDAGDTGMTPINAHLETGTDGKRQIVLSKA